MQQAGGTINHAATGEHQKTNVAPSPLNPEKTSRLHLYSYTATNSPLHLQRRTASCCRTCLHATSPARAAQGPTTPTTPTRPTTQAASSSRAGTCPLLRGAQPVGEHLVVLALVLAVHHQLLVEGLAQRLLRRGALGGAAGLARAQLGQALGALLGAALLECMESWGGGGEQRCAGEGEKDGTMRVWGGGEEGRGGGDEIGARLLDIEMVVMCVVHVSDVAQGHTRHDMQTPRLQLQCWEPACLQRHIHHAAWLHKGRGPHREQDGIAACGGGLRVELDQRAQVLERVLLQHVALGLGGRRGGGGRRR